jgi:hypothetical protein
MMVFTPTSMSEVGDTAKNAYFESWPELWPIVPVASGAPLRSLR